jgi:hypothetical protein
MNENSRELLDPNKIYKNISALEQRVLARFEGRNIAKRAKKLTELSAKAVVRSQQLAKPNYFLRLISILSLTLFIAAIAALLLEASSAINFASNVDLSELLQGAQAGIELVVFLGIVVLFIWSIETRIRRKALLTEIEYLQNFLHLINVGQLDKEPVRLDKGFKKEKNSPDISLDYFSMERYLSHSQKLAHYAAEVGRVYANTLVDAEVDNAAEELRRFAFDIARTCLEKMNILTLKCMNQTN